MASSRRSSHPHLNDDELVGIQNALEHLGAHKRQVSFGSHSGRSLVVLSESDELRLQSMTSQRKAEFRAGRVAAKDALRAAGSGSLVIESAMDGVPVFPSGYLGTIAHSHGRAVAAVVKAELAAGIGIDLEFDEDHDEHDLWRAVAAPGDVLQASLRSAVPKLHSPGTLLLSMKEALYKSVFPTLRRPFDFEDVVLRLDPETWTFHAVDFPGAHQLEVTGTISLSNRWVVTLALAKARGGV